MKLLEGKNVLIVGVANKHSIAAGIAESMAENGANIALTYQNERLQGCLLYTSPSPRDVEESRMPSSA